MRKELRRAMFRQQPVRLVPAIEAFDPPRGYPVGIGRKWLLLHALDDGLNLDGYSALRLGDVAAVEPLDGELPRRVLQRRGQWPPRPPEPAFPLDRTAALVLAAGAAYPLVALECPGTDPGGRSVGVPLGMQEHHLLAHLLGPDLAWPAEAVRLRLGPVRLVEAGRAYERALWEVLHPVAGQAESGP